MVPMAIPSFGGMCIELITLFVVPTLYCAIAEARLGSRPEGGSPDGSPSPSETGAT